MLGPLGPLLKSAPLFILALQVPTGIPEVLLAVRAGYVVTVVLIVLASVYVTSRVKAASDTTVIWVARPVDAAAKQRAAYAQAQAKARGEQWTPPPPPSPWLRTTYVELEQQKALEWAKGTAQTAALAFFLSLQMNVHVLLVMNLLTAFMGIWKHPLVTKHVFGNTPGEESEFMDSSIGVQLAIMTRQKDPKIAALAAKYVWGEKLVEPKTPARMIAERMVTCIVRAWDDAVDCDFSTILELIDAHGGDVNCAATPVMLASAKRGNAPPPKEGEAPLVEEPLRDEIEGWTPLMVAAGLPVDNATLAIAELLEMPHLRLDQQDAAGWTALHWAAYHVRRWSLSRSRPPSLSFSRPLPLFSPLTLTLNTAFPLLFPCRTTRRRQS